MPKITKAHTNSEELLTMKEAATLLKVSEISIKRYVSKGVIPSVKIGGARRVIKNEVWEGFVEYNKSEDEEYPEVTNGIQFYWSQKNQKSLNESIKKTAKMGPL